MSLLFRLLIALALLGMCLAASVLQTRASAVSDADKTIIVDAHNTARKSVMPTATNMRKMYWNDDLARVAQTWADQCKSGHDDDYERRQSANVGSNVGQNAASGFSSWTHAIQSGWYGEVKFYDWNTGSSNTTGKQVGHYTQVVWSASSLVGCGMADCGTSKHHVCNYAVGGNQRNTKPYVEGVEGESCAACKSKCVDKLCDCPNAKFCKNGGDLNMNDCSCTCKHGWSGDSCEICPAKDVWYCDHPSGYPASYCPIYSNVPAACPYMCGFCTA